MTNDIHVLTVVDPYDKREDALVIRASSYATAMEAKYQLKRLGLIVDVEAECHLTATTVEQVTDAAAVFFPRIRNRVASRLAG